MWYDKDDLRSNESLLAEIGRALNGSDYGIAIFSKAYFGKKWTLGELDGLYALETATRKIIIQIWLDVTVEDVKKIFPMLAGRKAIDGTLPIIQIADEIELIVDSARRAKSVTPFEKIKMKLLHAMELSTADANSSRLLRCTQGVDIIKKALTNAFDSIEPAIAEFARLQPGWNVVRTGIILNHRPCLVVHGPFGITGYVEVSKLDMNYATEMKLHISIRRYVKEPYEESEINEKLFDDSFEPFIVSEDCVKWFREEKTITNPAEFLLEELTRQIATRLAMGKRPK